MLSLCGHLLSELQINSVGSALYFHRKRVRLLNAGVRHDYLYALKMLYHVIGDTWTNIHIVHPYLELFLPNNDKKSYLTKYTVYKSYFTLKRVNIILTEPGLLKSSLN